MIHAPSLVQGLVPWPHPALPAAFVLFASLMSGSAAAQDATGEVATERRLPAGPTTDAPAGNPVYGIAEHADIGSRIKLQILWRKPVDGVRVNVMCRGDSVVLFGQIGSEAESQLAEAIALRTVGVGHVDNQLRVAPAESVAGEISAASARAPSDAWVSTRVAASLSFDRAVNAERVHVSTDDGVVTLSGRVATAAQKELAGAIAADIEDVEAVKNVLDVDVSN
jgi:osmotically-inducible protein OsmY